MGHDRIFSNQGAARFREARANGTNAVSLQSPATLAGDIDVFLISALPAGTEFLTIDASGQIASQSAGTGTLDDAYNLGRVITVDAGAVELNVPAASGNAALDIDQQDNNVAAVIAKTGTGVGGVVQITDAGTGTTLSAVKTGSSGTILNLNGLNGTLTWADQNAFDLQMGGTFANVAVFTPLASPTVSVVQINGGFGTTTPCLEIVGGTNTGIDISGADTGIDVSATNLPVTVTGGSTGGVSITQANAAAALAVTGGTASAVTVTQANDNRAVTITKSGAGVGSAVFIENDGTGNGITLQNDGVSADAALLLDVNGNTVGARIDSEATAEPLLELSPVTGNTRGDINFDPVRTADPTTPSEGDVWYREDLERFKYQLPGLSGRTAARSFASPYLAAFGLRMDKTIAGNTVTVNTGYTRLEAQISPGTDDLDTINSSPQAEIGDAIMITSETSDTITVRHGIGNIQLNGATNRTLNGNQDNLILVWFGANWVEWNADGL